MTKTHVADDVFSALVDRLRKDARLAQQWATTVHEKVQHAGLKSPGIPVILEVANGHPPIPPPKHSGNPSPPPPAPPPAPPITVQAYFWGFHFVIPHDSLTLIVNGGQAVNTFVELIGPETGPAAPFIEIAGVAVDKLLGIMSDMDAGKGIYLSMTWLLPGVFVPTAIY